MKPARGRLLVKPVETDEHTSGGKILLIADTRERMTQWQCEVIAVGEPPVCKQRKCKRAHAEHIGRDGIRRNVHPCAAEVGAWLLVRPRSYIEGVEPERKEWFVAQDDVWAILEA